MLELSTEEIIDILEGRLAAGLSSDQIGPIVTDTRKNLEGSWYLALQGENYDGHDFLGEAFSGGAIGCIVNERTAYPIASPNFPLIAVANTRLALARLARNWRRRLNYKVLLVASEELDQSQSISTDIMQLLEEKEVSASFIDTKFDSLNFCFERMLSFSIGLRCLVVNFSPVSIQEAELALDATFPDLCLLVGKPLEHIRLFASKEEIETVCLNIFSAVSKNGGTAILTSETTKPIQFNGELVLKETVEPSGKETEESRQWCLEQLGLYINKNF